MGHSYVQSRSAKYSVAAPVPEPDIQHNSPDNCREDHHRGYPAADMKFAAAHKFFVSFLLRKLPLAAPSQVFDVLQDFWFFDATAVERR